MAEKKQNIQDGKNIELDGITVINEGISLAEKEEVKEETSAAPAEVAPEIEITPDVKIETSETAKEETPVAEETPAAPVEVAPEIVPTDIPAPVAIDIDPVAVDPISVEPEPVVIPTPETSIASEEAPIQNEIPAYDIASQPENPIGYESVVDNRPQVPSVPDNVLNAFEVARNEVAEIYMKNQEYSEKIQEYERELAEKDQTILDKDKQINELSTKLANYEAKLSLVRNKVLDEFGLGGMAVEQTPAQPTVAPTSTTSFTDSVPSVEIDNSTSLAA